MGGSNPTTRYNGIGARTSKTDSTGTFSFKRDGASVTDDVLNDGAAEYTPGISENRSGTSKFYHAVILATTSLITNATQAVTDTNSFDAFGNLVSSTGSTLTPFGFAGGFGYEQDHDSGLILTGHRYYDPACGRFITRDPARDGRNWNQYCRNNPGVSVDPAGLNILSEVWGAIKSFGLLVKGALTTITIVPIVLGAQQVNRDKEASEEYQAQVNNFPWQDPEVGERLIAQEKRDQMATMANAWGMVGNS